MHAASHPLLIVFGLIGAAATMTAGAGGAFGGSLAVTSDDIDHAISQTCGDPAAQADVHFRTTGGLAPSETFVGVWASAGLGSTPCTSAKEVNAYAGHRFATGADSSATLSYVHYAYPGGGYTFEPLAGHRYDYDELDATWSFQDRLSVTAAWTPDAVRYEYTSVSTNRRALSLGLELHQPLVRSLALSAGTGYDEIADPYGAGYAFWNAGLDYTVGAFDVSVSYFRTSDRAERLFGAYVAGGRGSATVLWRF